MPHDDSEHDDNKPHVHDENCGCSIHGGGLKYTPPEERAKHNHAGPGLAAKMVAMSKGEHDHSHSHDDHHHGHSHCGHDHHDHDHHHHSEDQSFNHGILKTLFSKANIADDSFLSRHRSKIVLGASAALAAIETQTTGSSTLGALGMMFGAAAVAHDATEDLMETTGKLTASHKISSGVVGMGVGAAHTASEFFLSAFSDASTSDMVVATTMGSNVSHIPLMAGMAGVIGAVSIDKLYAYKMNTVAMAGVTGAFAYQIATGDFNPYLSAGMAGAGLGYLRWRVKAGQTCAVHGDACGHNHGHADETDYISIEYARETAKKIKNIKPGEMLERLNERVKETRDKFANVTMPTREEVTTKLKKVGKAISHENIVNLGASLGALGVSAHILGDNVIRLAEQGNLSTTAMGATAAALAFALPELILTGKAAAKKDGEMAWGAVTGCTIATVGIVGGYQGLSGLDVPAALDLATTEGKVQMAAFVGSAATIIAAVNPWVADKLAKVDNAAADLFEGKFQGVSNWLRNDGTKLSKVAAAPMVAAALTYYAASTLPVCHSHDNGFMHCFDRGVQTQVDPNAVLKLD
jgi:Ca2+/Na+ antiporter